MSTDSTLSYLECGRFFNAAFMFTQKGAKKRTDKYKVTATPAYLQIPIHFGYRSAIGRKCYVFGETGHYFACGVSEKLKYSESEYTYVDAYGIDWFGDGEDEYGGKRFDVGWGVRAGFECGGFQVHVGYEYGFTTMLEDGKNHNNNIALGVSCFF